MIFLSTEQKRNAFANLIRLSVFCVIMALSENIQRAVFPKEELHLSLRSIMSG